MKHYASWLVIAGTVIVLGVTSFTIWRRHEVVISGAPILLELRPVDPRSLIQGDYMRLAYADAVFPSPELARDLPHRGTFIVSVDGRDVATFSRIDDGSKLAEGEYRLKYKLLDQSGGIRLGAESFFFEEGQADVFDDAHYGVLRVDDAGTSVLVGLADESGRLIVAGQ